MSKFTWTVVSILAVVVFGVVGWMAVVKLGQWYSAK